MTNKIAKSASARLALRFTIFVTLAVLVLSVAFSIVVGVQVRSEKNQELQECALRIEKELSEEQFDFSLPYYITYVVWSQNEGQEPSVISTNDPFLPLLPLTGSKSRSYIAKNYFIDGDLNILYFSKSSFYKGKNITIQTCVNMDTDSTRQMNQQIPKVVAIAFFPILFISFFVSLFLTRHTLSPVVKMTHAAREISSENLESQLPVSSHHDELDELAATFNDLFAKLKRDFDRERQFTSDVSHELKTPVAVILGQANLLRRWGKDDPAQLEKSLATIIGETKSMQAIIENLLQMSRLESGRIKPELVYVNIYKLYERIKTETESLCENCKFIIGDCEKTQSVLADEELLHQVLTVVISNSIKYTTAVIEEDGSCRKPVLTVCAQKEKDRVVLTLEDNGKGFDPDSIEHVFERFFRQDSSHTRKAGGSGLGLSIARTIVNCMNGTITAYNTPSHGAGIRITLKD